jgi:Tfp pilus assembly protein PilX
MRFFYSQFFGMLQHTRSSRARSQSGQVGIIVVLLMVVLLTFGLAIASRTSQEVALQQQEEDSTRVFNAAEAGVERGLSTDLDFQGESLQPSAFQLNEANSTVNYSITKQRSLQTRLFQGSTAHFQLSDATTRSPSGVTILWAKEANCAANPASLIISIFTQDPTSTPLSYRTKYMAVAGCDHGDSFTTAQSGSNGYLNKVTIPLQANDIFIRVKPVYNDTQLLISSSNGETVPVQAYQIHSEAKSDAGNETRAVNVYRTLPVAPSVFDYALFSGRALRKQVTHP